jgi:hypothetical protein
MHSIGKKIFNNLMTPYFKKTCRSNRQLKNLCKP